jgi:magnesium chelatase family protein
MHWLAKPMAKVRRRCALASSRHWPNSSARQSKPNSRLTAGEVDTRCLPDEAGGKLLKQASTHLDLSARAWHRILKVARTIADLADSEEIRAPHVAEAIQYRRFARG